MNVRKLAARTVAGVVGTAVALSLALSPAQADTTKDPLAIVQSVAPVPSVNDTTLKTDNSTVTLPADETGEITLTTKEGTLSIGLPGARKGNRAQKGHAGVAFDRNGGLTNVARIAKSPDGKSAGAQTWALLNGPSSSHDITYKIRGAKSIKVAPGGGLIAYNARGVPIAFAPPAMAFDANKNPIKAHFTTNGKNAVTVHVTKNNNAAYPVAVDPLWAPAVAAAVTSVALGCVAGAAQGFIQQGAKWALQRGDWHWNQRLWEATDNCIWGALFGWAGWFLPHWIKQQLANAIRQHVYNVLRWTVLR